MTEEMNKGDQTPEVAHTQEKKGFFDQKMKRLWNLTYLYKPLAASAVAQDKEKASVYLREMESIASVFEEDESSAVEGISEIDNLTFQTMRTFFQLLETLDETQDTETIKLNIIKILRRSNEGIRSHVERTILSNKEEDITENKKNDLLFFSRTT